MQLDDLKTTWKEELQMQEKMTDFDKIRRNVDKYDKRIKMTWAIELLACIGVVLVIAFAWFNKITTQAVHPLFHLGSLAVVLACAFVGWKIIHSKKLATHNDWTLAAKLNRQIEKREKEAKLLSQVAYWYLTPLLVAILFASYGGFVQRTGGYLPDLNLVGYWGGCLLLYVGIYFFNQHQLKTKIRPMLEQLYTLKRELQG